MKTINIFFISILMASVVGLTVSCDSVSDPDPVKVVDSTKTAAIEGTAYANLDKTNDTSPVTVEEDYERAPKGTTVNIVVKNSEYKRANPGQPPQQGSQSYKTTIDENGKYSKEFPATDEEMNVNVSFGDFQAEQTSASSKEEKTFTLSGGSSQTVSLSAGITKVKNAKYTVSSQSSGLINPEKTTTIKGTVYANLDVTNDSPSASQEEKYEGTPAGTIVKVVVDNSEYNLQRPGSTSYKTTTDEDGNYSIEIPATDGKMSVDLIYDSFRADQIQAGFTSREMIFEASSKPLSVSADITSFVDNVFYSASSL